jgi:predicted PurR-regulated permease PerM
MPSLARDLTRDTLAVLFLVTLIAASFWILRPFLGAVIWATMIVVATWPFLLTLERRLFGRRWLAVSAMTILLLCVFVVPFSLTILALVQNFDEIAAGAKSLVGFTLPPPPDWLTRLPVVGSRIGSSWRELAALDQAELAARLSPYLGEIVRWLAAQLGSFGLLIAQVALTVVIAAVLYASGESGAHRILRFGYRLAGARGETAVRLAGQAIRGVALGVVVTSLIQAVFGGIGLALAGVPFTVVLSAVMFLLAVVQIGVGPVLFGAVGWLYWTGAAAWGTALLVWTVLLLALNDVLRPILIQKGAPLPLLLIMAGTIGGLLAFGIIGIFVGPVVLAVAYTLLEAWMGEDPDIGSTARASGPEKGGSVSTVSAG